MGDGAVRVDQVERLDVHDDEAMSAAYSIWRAAYTEEFPDDPLPTAPEVLARAHGPEISARHEYWLLRDGGEPIGVYELELPLADNIDLVDLSLAVAPEHQHRGHGRVLLDHALQRIAELGRHQVIGSVNEPADGSQNRPMRFAAAAGASRSLGEMRRTLDLRGLDQGRLAALRDEAERAAEGYQLVAWTGPCPDELVDGYAALVARMSTDAPMGGLDIEPEHWDAARIRERDQVMAAQGRRAGGHRRPAGEVTDRWSPTPTSSPPRTTCRTPSSGTRWWSRSTAATGWAPWSRSPTSSGCATRRRTPDGCTPGTPTRTPT